MRKTLRCAALIFSVLIAPAVAQAQQSGTAQTMAGPGFQNVPWTSTPDAATLSRFYPERAIETGAPGYAALDCVIDAEHRPVCTVTEEAPVDLGFGQAAVRASRTFVAAEMFPDGASTVAAHARLLIHFAGGSQEIRPLAPDADMFWDSGAILQFYPARARRAHVEGWVREDCIVNASLHYDCTLVSETPPNWGFADAAKGMMRNFFLTRDTRQPSPIGRRQTFEIHFREQR